jgi:PAS domain S-box-containing protein
LIFIPLIEEALGGKNMNCQLVDIIDISSLQKIIEKFNILSGIGVIILNNDDVLLVSSGRQEVCEKYHSLCCRTAQQCRPGNAFIKSNLQEGSWLSYKCLNGLMECAAPIIVEQHNIGTVILGQYLSDPVNEEFFRTHAHECEFEPESYLESLRKVPIIPQAKIESITAFFSEMIGILISMGQERKLQLDANQQTIQSYEESKQRYRAIVNDQNELICRFLPDGTLVFVNEAYCRYFNKNQEELLGQSFMPLIPEEDHEIIKQNIAGICMENPLVSYEHRIILPSGEIRWQSWTDRAIFDHQGNIVECQSVGRDITTRKEAEEALCRSEECFRKIFDTSQNLICIASLEDSTYINVNESWERYTGYTREEAIGRTTMDLNLVVNTAEFEGLIGGFLEHKKLDNLEIAYRTKSNQIRLALCSVNLIDIASKSCILVILTDITEYRLLEKNMGRLDQLRLVGEMAASIAHEIRNPMTTVRGFLQLFGEQRRYAEDKENIDLMIGEIDRANFIISEYLSLGRTRLVNLAPESLNNILNSLKPLILADALMSDKAIIFDLGPIPNLLLDENEIRQIILNLTRNGLDATPLGGGITIRTFAEGNEVVLSVGDQGPGIRPEHIENLGIPFFTTKEDGTGLGLAVCYGIARRHNAIIDIKTGSSGTTFFVRFKSSV